MIIKICEKVLCINTNIFSIFYSCFLLILAVVGTRISFPDSFFTNPKNDINAYFTNNVPFFTFILLVPFVFCLNMVYGFGRIRNVFMPLFRVIINFIIVYFISEKLHLFGVVLDKCKESEKSETADVFCAWNKYSTLAFEVTGETFRGVFTLLTIMEEASNYKIWSMVEQITKPDPESQSNVTDQQVTPEDRKLLIYWSNKYETFLKGNFIALFILVILVHITNILNAVYFHYLWEHVVAIALALMLWFLCYRLIYPLHDTDPGLLEIYRQLWLTPNETADGPTAGSHHNKTYDAL